MVFMFIGFLVVYFLLSFYVIYNGWIWLHKAFQFQYKKSYFIVMFFVSISFFLSQFLSISILRWIGYGWLIIFLYSLLLFPIFNFIYFLNKKKGIKWFGYCMLIVYVFVFSYGSFNMWNPTIVRHEIEVQKETELDELKVLLVSDIHINDLIGTKFINKLIRLNDEVKPDAIFLAGDVIDNSMEPYMQNNIGKTLANLNAPMGVYAVLGNHEYYGGHVQIFIEEMNKIDIQVLIDETLNYNDLFYLVGRRDYNDKERVSIEELTVDLDKEKPIFVIDHQPREFDEVSSAGVDLMVSGHTHKGQLFPGNLVTNAIYENHYGHLQVGSLHTIVSSGFGLWGPPFRIGSRAEVVEITIKFVD